MNRTAPVPPRLTAIGSGKGGTGKTMIAIHLAHALAKLGEHVLLCDADLGLSNTTVHLGLGDGGDLAAVILGDCEIEDTAVSVFGGIAKGGFDLLAAPSGSGAMANSTIPAVVRLIAALRSAQTYDRIILDLGAGVAATTMSLAAAADETIAVLTPDPAALTDAYAFAKLLLRTTKFRAPDFIVNMCVNETEARRIADAFVSTCRSFLKIDPLYLASVPRDTKALDAVRRQQCLTAMDQSPAVRAIERAARLLHDRLYPPKVAAAGLR